VRFIPSKILEQALGKLSKVDMVAGNKVGMGNSMMGEFEVAVEKLKCTA